MDILADHSIEPRRIRSVVLSALTALVASASKAELHLQSATRCFGPEVCMAKQGVLIRADELHESRFCHRQCSQ